MLRRGAERRGGLRLQQQGGEHEGGHAGCGLPGVKAVAGGALRRARRSTSSRVSATSAPSVSLKNVTKRSAGGSGSAERAVEAYTPAIQSPVRQPREPAGVHAITATQAR